ncbi:MAG: DUF4234 domain-containing protein, partial [Deltaproteobacteria bacterium]|nr:DUF4234 domain-containing protein [Deltaproteobacteria bacterium]
IALYLVLTIITCGLANIYWNYRQIQACNELLGHEEFSFWLSMLLVLVTCGLYHIFYQYKMGSALVEIQLRNDRPPFENLPVISVIVTVLGLPFVVDCIHQHEINKIVTG